MAGLNRYTQTQLASSLVGVPSADRSGQIIAGSIQKAASDFGNTIVQNAFKKQAAEDSLSINAANESRDLAKLEMEQFMLTNPNPSTWEAGRQSVLRKQQFTFSQQKFSFQTNKNESVKQKAFESESELLVSIAATEQTIQNDITVSGKNIIGIFSNPLATEKQKQDQQKLFQDALERKHPKNVADVMMQDTLAEAEEEKTENINDI